MRSKFAWIFPIVFFALSSCAIQDVEYVSLNNYAINKVGKNEARLTLNVKLNNPNKFNIKIVKANLQLSVGGNDAGKVVLTNKVKLKKRSETDYDIIIEVDPEQITRAAFKSGLTIMLTGKAAVRVKGWVKGRAFGIGAKVDVDESHQVDVGKFKSFE